MISVLMLDLNVYNFSKKFWIAHHWYDFNEKNRKILSFFFNRRRYFQLAGFGKCLVFSSFRFWQNCFWITTKHFHLQMDFTCSIKLLWSPNHKKCRNGPKVYQPLHFWLGIHIGPFYSFIYMRSLEKKIFIFLSI